MYFLKQKSKVVVAFKNFKAFVENKSDYMIKFLWSDKGGEFTFKDFNDCCKFYEICSPLMIHRLPQQNGVVEKKNRTILNMARCMMKARSMPKEFWTEVVSCTVYLSNCLPKKKHE